MDAFSTWFRHAIVLASAGIWCFGALPLRSQWIDYRTPGVPRTADGKVNLAAPAPKTADGKPDLSGVWESAPEYFYDLANDLRPDEVVMQPWAKALQAEREAKLHQDDPLARCMPPGVPRIDMSTPDAPHPFKIVQTPALVVLLYETSSNSTFRQVFLDGRPLPKDPQPTWLGYSIGHWEGAALVVDTRGFNGLSWTDTAKGHPQTAAAHVIERFTRRDFGHLEIDITIDDPQAYAKPWRASVPVKLLPDTDLIETYCENEKDQVHKR
ncbi:MAG TPA: hypothetical protein VKV17_10445 [Bryobacteraceae bacterium]|nr:hypothetical protein [Bryobacteraceae bacterium]